MFKRKKGSDGQSVPLANKALAEAFTRRADLARDQGRFREASTLYDEAIKLGAPGGPIRVQAGHMFKESADLGTAERY